MALTRGVSRDTLYPNSYSSVVNGRIMPVKDQGSDGTCWAFSATACVEAGLIASDETGVDLSTLQLVNYFYNDKFDPLGNATGDKTTNIGENCLDLGGNHLFTMWGLAGWTNGAPERALPYNNANRSMVLNGTPSDAGLNWSVSGENGVVSVTQNGNTFTVKGLKAGDTTLRFTDSRSGKSK